MIELNTTRYKLPPYKHQREGVKLLLKHPVFGLFWKPRLGKSKTVIDTACELFAAGEIDTLLLVAPAQVRDIWTEKTLGEIKTHDWSGAQVFVHKTYGTLALPAGKPCYVACSVEFLRQAGPRNDYPMVDDLLAALHRRRVWFVFDEGSVLGDWKTVSVKSMVALREGEPIKRVTVLDGTPRGNRFESFYSKFKVLDPKILDCRTFFHFQNHYCKVARIPHPWASGKQPKFHIEVVGEKGDEFAKKTAPHCQFLEQDVLDMPKKVPGILTVAMNEKTWKVYTQMRDEMVAELEDGRAAVSHAAIKCIRLAQICAGFLGGVQEFTQMNLDGRTVAGAFNRGMCEAGNPITTEVHDAPTDMLMGWLKLRLAEDPNFKCVVWSRFVPEIERLGYKLLDLFRGTQLGIKYSGAETYRNQLHPQSNYVGPYVLVCQPQTAQYGNNFSKARTSLFLSQDYNRVTRAQSAERVQAHGAGETTSELDVVVTGPRGQKTVVHDIINVVREREDAEKRTAADWKRVLTEE